MNPGVLAKVTQLVIRCRGCLDSGSQGLCQPSEWGTLAVGLFLGRLSKNFLVTSQNQTKPPQTLKLFCFCF